MQLKMLHSSNQAKLRAMHTILRYKYRFKIHKNYDHSVHIDTNDKITEWQNVTHLEMTQ